MDQIVEPVFFPEKTFEMALKVKPKFYFTDRHPSALIKPTISSECHNSKSYYQDKIRQSNLFCLKLKPSLMFQNLQTSIFPDNGNEWFSIYNSNNDQVFQFLGRRLFLRYHAITNKY